MEGSRHSLRRGSTQNVSFATLFQGNIFLATHCNSWSGISLFVRVKEFGKKNPESSPATPTVSQLCLWTGEDKAITQVIHLQMIQGADVFFLTFPPPGREFCRETTKEELLARVLKPPHSQDDHIPFWYITQLREARLVK